MAKRRELCIWRKVSELTKIDGEMKLTYICHNNGESISIIIQGPIYFEYQTDNKRRAIILFEFAMRFYCEINLQ